MQYPIKPKRPSVLRGHTPPSVAGHYTGLPSLMMRDGNGTLPQESILETPDTVILRCTVHVTYFDAWPRLKSGVSFDHAPLYSEEGRRLKQGARIESISLYYDGYCSTPTALGARALCPGLVSLLPFEKGGCVFRQCFAPLPRDPIEPQDAPGTLNLYSLGGSVGEGENHLKARPLYFFLEEASPRVVGGGGGGISEKVRFMFDPDIQALSRTHPGLKLQKTFEGEVGDLWTKTPPHVTLVQGGCVFTLKDPLGDDGPLAYGYRSIDVYSVGDNLVEMLLTRL